MAQHNKWQRNISAILATSILAGALSGCTISDDPLTNAAATAATCATLSLGFLALLRILAVTASRRSTSAFHSALDMPGDFSIGALGFLCSGWVESATAAE